MPDKPVSRRGPYASGERTRAALVDAALHLFAEQGFQRQSLRQIAELLGTSHTVLRRHFGTKEHLLTAVLESRGDDEAPQRDDLVGSEGFLAAFPQVLAAHAGRRGVIGLDTVLRVEALDASHPAHELVRRQGREFREQVTQALRDEREAGRLRDDVDPAALAPLVTALVSGLQTAWLENPDEDMAAHARTFVELLRPPPAAGDVPDVPKM
ncbi:TetR/AcrR family transcriptional regulator [Arsenicicoccus piscis]|uniref:TetR family transcriptional regulator n=1 Tax=Arsenicicoccus piscis TaxID=673954 RepID=A0ABQ6HS18_9MICO|nr:TetR/AcrR family transcriptional regulator [Arsenicicoccus piscis]MCH8626364.1 TetR/AcrR family transcriptional regulator [Arsenicicoccus piscis]GMA20977.1 TetR family transcriptional regulator [Arsenicicoccus piscis]